MSAEVIDQKTELKPGECYGTWSAKHDECVSICATRDRCKKATLAAGRSISAVPISEDDGFDPSLASMDPLEYLISGLKGKFEEDTTQEDSYTLRRYRHKGNPIAIVLVSKSTKMLRIYVGSEKSKDPQKSLLFREGLTSVKQAHALLAHVLFT